MTWTQLYILAGMVVIGCRITGPAFYKSAAAGMKDGAKKGRSPRFSYLCASVAVCLAVAVWPAFLLFWFFEIMGWRK